MAAKSVAHTSSNGDVSVISRATDTVIAEISVGSNPIAFGLFIQPMTAKQFVGIPGKPNCFGQSVSALARQYGGLNAAAAALDYPTVRGLQQAIMDFCEG